MGGCLKPSVPCWPRTQPIVVVGMLAGFVPVDDIDRTLSTPLVSGLSTDDPRVLCRDKGASPGGGPGGGGGSGMPGSHLPFLEDGQASFAVLALVDVPSGLISPVDAALLAVGGIGCVGRVEEVEGCARPARDEGIPGMIRRLGELD